MTPSQSTDDLVKLRLADASAGNIVEVQQLLRLCADAFDTIERLQGELAAKDAQIAEEHGWVIERADSDASAPKYWVAGQREAERTSAWTSNHMAAIRFARKEDAEATAKRLFPAIDVRIAEHGWSTDAPLRCMKGRAQLSIACSCAICQDLAPHKDAAIAAKEGA